MNPFRFFRLMTLVFCAALITGAAHAADPLPAWNDGAAKQAILQFVKEVTDSAGRKYVRPEERIAVFDSDGTLWCERPLYAQIAFIFDRIRTLSKNHPEWKPRQPYKAVIENDLQYLSNLTEKELLELLTSAHGGTTPEDFTQRVNQWLAAATHPRFNVRYSQTVYQPMIELLAYLRDNGFTTFICSGSGSDFIRAFSEEVFGIPVEQVIGSHPKYDFVDTPEGYVILRQPILGMINDREQKPINIQIHTGRRPLITVGNADGDLQMLRFSDFTKAPGLSILIRHDDAAREYAYDTGTAAVVAAAAERGWCTVSMQKDFKKIFSFER